MGDLPLKVAVVLVGAAALYPATLIFKQHGAGGWDAKPLGPRLMPTFMLVKAISFLVFGLVCLAGVTGDSPPTGPGDAENDLPWDLVSVIMSLGGQRSTWPVALLGSGVMQLLELLLYATSPAAYGGIPGWASSGNTERPWQIFALLILWNADIFVPHELMWMTKPTSLRCLRWNVAIEKAVVMIGVQQSFMISVFGGSALNDPNVGYSIGAILQVVFQAGIACSMMATALVEAPYCFVMMVNFVDVALKNGLSGGIMSQEPLVVRVVAAGAALSILASELLLLWNYYA